MENMETDMGANMKSLKSAIVNARDNLEEDVICVVVAIVTHRLCATRKAAIHEPQRPRGYVEQHFFVPPSDSSQKAHNAILLNHCRVAIFLVCFPLSSLASLDPLRDTCGPRARRSASLVYAMSQERSSCAWCMRKRT